MGVSMHLDRAEGVRASRSFLFVSFVLAAIALLSSTHSVRADEGAIGVYFPGFYGSLGMAEALPEGFYLMDFVVYSNLDTPLASKGGDLHIDIDSSLFVNGLMPYWVTDKKVFGGTYSVGVVVLLEGLVLRSSMHDPDLGISFDQRTSNVGFGDVYAVPIALSWAKKNTFYMFYEGINVPLGEYTSGSCCNLGLNIWSFDSNFSFTYYNPKKLVQFDSNLGFMYNTKNHDTDYQSGANIHWDFTLGFNLSDRLQVGLSGYVYQQVVGDSGSGAILGDFKGEGFGLGPSVSYVFDTKRPLELQFEWIHDLHTENRLAGDWFTLTLIARIPPLVSKK